MRRLAVLGVVIGAAIVLVRRARRGNAVAAVTTAAPPVPEPASLPAPPSPPVPPAPDDGADSDARDGDDPDEGRFLSVPWTAIGASPEQTELRVRYRATEQMTLDRVDVQETATQVFLTVLVRWEPAAGGWFSEARQGEASAGLGAPLGDRALVHAPVDWPHRPPARQAAG